MTYHPHARLSPRPRKKLRQLISPKPGSEMESEECGHAGRAIRQARYERCRWRRPSSSGACDPSRRRSCGALRHRRSMRLLGPASIAGANPARLGAVSARISPGGYSTRIGDLPVSQIHWPDDGRAAGQVERRHRLHRLPPDVLPDAHNRPARNAPSRLHLSRWNGLGRGSIWYRASALSSSRHRC